MTVAELVSELLDLVAAGPPSALQIQERLSRLTAPPTAVQGTVNDWDGAVLALDSQVVGIHIREDSRGWGAAADLVLRHGTLAEIESVVGPVRPPMARAGVSSERT